MNIGNLYHNLFTYDPEDAIYNLPKGSLVQNLDDWGRTPDTNILYISGVPGSGKTTLSDVLENNNVEVIHLDSYFDDISGKKNIDLNNFLDKKMSDYRDILLPIDEISMNDWKKVVLEFESDLDEYGEYAYTKNKKVIVEGTHLLDDTLRADKKYFVDKPVIILSTDAQTSIDRANKRDNKTESDTDMEYRLELEKYINNFKSLNNFNEI